MSSHDVTDPNDPRIFVFGSNRRGVHGAGAALFAVQHKDAIPGKGEGIQGESYGIPTKDERLKTLSLDEIRKGVERFLAFARQEPSLRFKVTRIGCGLAGYTDDDIAPMFAAAPENCDLPDGWRRNRKS